MEKVSFDFDGTLDRDNVFEIAKKLIAMGVEIWIVTGRCTQEEYMKINLYYDNHDLFEVADKLGIPDERIVFTNLKPKSLFFNSTDKRFTAHLDDDVIEVEDIVKNGKTIAICVDNRHWDETIKRLFKLL
jgi:hypothetical protein